MPVIRHASRQKKLEGVKPYPGKHYLSGHSSDEIIVSFTSNSPTSTIEVTPPRKTRPRNALKRRPKTLSILETAFRQSPNPDEAVKKALACKLHRAYRDVCVWFDNRQQVAIEAKNSAALQRPVISAEDDDTQSCLPLPRVPKASGAVVHILTKTEDEIFACIEKGATFWVNGPSIYLYERTPSGIDVSGARWNERFTALTLLELQQQLRVHPPGLQ